MSASEADLRTQVDQLRTDRLAGKVSQTDFLARMDELGPKLATAPAPPAPGKPEAQRQLDELRQRRIDGKVGEAEYMQEAEQLAALAAGETPPPVPPSNRFEAQLAEFMRVPEPHEYQIPHPETMDEEGLAFDAELRQALVAMQVPAYIGGRIVQRAEQAIAELSDLAVDLRENRVEAFRNRLRAQWGDQYGKRTQAIVDLVADATAKHEQVGAVIDAYPWLLADFELAERLWSLIEFRESRK